VRVNWNMGALQYEVDPLYYPVRWIDGFCAHHPQTPPSIDCGIEIFPDVIMSRSDCRCIVIVRRRIKWDVAKL